jgi:tetratricopeptide (TPR) repeat protein
MIIVEPTSSRFESGTATLSSDEHLLERISAAEARTARLAERLEPSLEFLLRYPQNAYFHSSLNRAHISLVEEDGVIQSTRLEKLWSERCERDALEQEEHVQRDELRLRILAHAQAMDRPVFAELVNEGFLLIEDKQVQEGIAKLQRAAEMSDENAALNLYIGEHYFRRGKTKHARTYLTRAHEALPDDVRVSLLLGLSCADDGEVEQAKNLLSEAMRQGGSSFAAHYGLGWLFVTEKNWRRALGEFKRALTARPSPEAHYVLGCLYYELNRDELAVRHLRKAVQMDESYAEAFQLLAQAYERTGRKELACEALKRAGHRATHAPLFQLTKLGTRGLIASADKRLADMLRDDALNAFEVATSSSH